MYIPLPDKKYQIIYADPPWEYKNNRCLAKASILDGKINTHYKTLSNDELYKLSVKDIADKNCLLFLWCVSPKLNEALELMTRWGFTYKTIAFVWDKQRINPGYYTLSQCEICLVGKIGKIPPDRGARNIKQFLSKHKSKHSEKPQEIRENIEKMFPTHTRIELFAREKTLGWDVWGDEV